jgi:translation elongation factor EF-1beta
MELELKQLAFMVLDKDGEIAHLEESLKKVEEGVSDALERVENLEEVLNDTYKTIGRAI